MAASSAPDARRQLGQIARPGRQAAALVVGRAQGQQVVDACRPDLADEAPDRGVGPARPVVEHVLPHEVRHSLLEQARDVEARAGSRRP